MAKTSKKRGAPKSKGVPSLQCPTNPKVDPKGKRGVCYTVEHVQRNGHKGYITTFQSRATGKSAGFLAVPGTCKRTLDPFQASIRSSKTSAVEAGQRCAKASLG